MADLPPIAVVLKADTSDFTKGVDHARKSLDGLEPSAKRGGGAMGALKFAAIGGAAVLAAKGVMDFASSAVTAAQESLVADRRLDQIAKSMGYVKGEFAGTTDRLKEFAGTLSSTIGVEDESIKATQGVLLTFSNLGDTANETGGMFDRATKAAYDLASAGFGSAEGNAKQLGKALNDPIKGIAALAKAGVTFTAQEKERIKTLVESNKLGEAQAMVMSAIEKQVGGTAQATATGVDRMKVAFGELQEAVGGPLAEVMTQVADAITPILNDLQGPLKEVATQVGGALKEAFTALAPVLPTLAKALGQLAGTMGTLLASAIQILVPIVTPLLEMFAELAQGILPRLQPILLKVGEVFGKLMEAIMPLLPPLMDLVFTVFDAAAPIIDIAAQVLLTLIDALSPIIGIVASLLPVLGTLINTLFKAIMPILKPILPLIETLASLFGDLLARSLGIIVTALGGLIIAFSKLAPFVLNNVTKPVLEMFLTFAEGIVGAAATAFGWIPGLGDKLNTAKDAIGTFKTSATKAISDAAVTIGTEGEKIGKGLIDQGVALVKDPSQVAKAKNAGMQVGTSMADGMAQGIKVGTPDIASQAAVSINQAERAARQAAKSQSPSQLFADVGDDLSKGLAQGIKAGGDNIRQTLQETYVEWFQSTVETLKGKLQDARDAFNSFKTDVANAISGGIDFSAAAPKYDEDGKRVGGTFIEALTKQAEDAKNFAAKVKELITMGLSREALTQVLAAGVTAGTDIANELISGGATTINQTNDLVATTQAAADEVGLLAATNFEGAGVTSAEATLKGFKDEFGKGGKSYKRLQDLMDNLAKSMERSTTITVTTIHRAVYESVGKPPANPSRRAIGGPVFANVPYLVGERGPELFIPNGVSGSIIPTDRLGPTGKQEINVYATTNADAHDISREIAWALKVGV